MVFDGCLALLMVPGCFFDGIRKDIMVSGGFGWGNGIENNYSLRRFFGEFNTRPYSLQPHDSSYFSNVFFLQGPSAPLFGQGLRQAQSPPRSPGAQKNARGTKRCSRGFTTTLGVLKTCEAKRSRPLETPPEHAAFYTRRIPQHDRNPFGEQ